MRKINLNDVPSESSQSPKGKYAAVEKGISIALGRAGEHWLPEENQPFDVELASVPPGRLNFPYHSHSAQWEFYLFISGNGKIRQADGWTEIGAGDALLFGPSEAHQICNSGTEDLVYYVIADNPIGDACYYPDSDKWAVATDPKDEKIIKGQDADYYLGEE
jgi:uncharacterized cupin superfamily protein